jgi:hypothetical protein
MALAGEIAVRGEEIMTREEAIEQMIPEGIEQGGICR